MKTTKKPKGLEPCREFKSFRLFNSVSLFLKIPFSRVQILAVGKNRKMDRYFFEKKAGTKKTGEISRNLPFSAVWLSKRLFSSCGSILTTQHGRGRRIRTRDPRFWRPVLYQLSYTPVQRQYYSTHSVKKQGVSRKIRKLFCSVTIDVRPKAKKL